MQLIPSFRPLGPMILVFVTLLLTPLFLPNGMPRTLAAQQPEAATPPAQDQANLVAADPTQIRAAEDFFENRIRPLMIDHCYECHSSESGESSGGFRIDDSAALRRGGLSGPAIVVGDAGKSLLIRAVEYHETALQMPPEGKLEESQIQDLRDWINTGAYDPREATGDDLTHQESTDPTNHWAFQSPTAASGPKVVHATSRDIIDAVVASRLPERSMEPSTTAAQQELLRRMAFDLTGLPPSSEIAESFLNDTKPDAYERLVEKFLATPEFGERWARHWMDVARYADTVGYALGGKERRLRGSERYRDWLVENFNEDLPYDQMIRMQLAADVFDPEGTEGHLDAMGYLTIGRQFLSRLDILDDQIDVVSRGLLGLTVTCARCHDHKFDPIPTTDYYSWFGIFNSSKRDEAENTNWPLRMLDADNVHDARVLVRGQPGNHGAQVPRAFLSILEEGQPKPFTEGSGRKELAEHIADDQNPLTARVFVNRVWQHLVGSPMVTTPSDFGVRTEPPVHPELLDDLAVDFMQHQWSVKHLVRRIVLTHLYRQASTADDASIEADPENRWLARANRKRLDFEAMRDSCLLVSGRLQRTLGGEPVDILKEPSPPRRTVYAFIDRQQLPGVFRVFDLASPDAHTPERFFTTVPQQALFLLNNPFLMQAAADVVERAERQTLACEKSGAEEIASGTNREAVADVKSDETLVRHLFELVLRRAPSDDELSAALEFVARPSTLPLPITAPARQWQYGVGRLSDQGSVGEFVPFPSFINDRYQGSETFPDSTWSYSSLTARGGHPGPGPAWSVVRRLTADRNGKGKVSGYIEHPSDQGDGVRLRVFAGSEMLFETIAKTGKRPIKAFEVTLQNGQTLDFVVDDNGSTSFDSFNCKFNVNLIGEDGQQIRFTSEADFRGPAGAEESGQPLNRYQQLAQVLLLSNEFTFVD